MAMQAGVRRLGRRARWSFLGIGLISAIYAGVFFVAKAQLQNLLPKAVAVAVGGRDAEMYSVQVGTVRLSPVLSGLTVKDVVVSVDSARAEAAAEPALVRSASLGSVRVSGIRLIPLLRGKGIFVSSIDIVGPTVALEFAPGQMKEPSASDEEGTEASVPESGASSPTAVLGRVRVRDGSVDITRVTDRGTLLSFLHGLDLELTEIRINSVTFANPASALANSRVSLAFDTARHTFDDSLYVVTATQVRADSRDSLAQIGTVQLTPTLEADPFFERLPQRADRINMSAGPVRVEGLDFARYVNEESVHVRLIGVDSLDLHVYSDINMEWGPKAQPCRYHMGFGDIEFPLRVDTIQVNDAMIRYSELAKGSERAGEVTLEELTGTVVNLTNDPNRMTHETPAVASVTAKLFGESDMEATLAYPLLSQTLDFSFEASLGPMSLAIANRFATNAAGVELEQGQLNSLWVGVDVQDGRADGSVHMLYQDFDFRLVDKNSLKEKPWHTVAGFVGGLIVRSNNPGQPDETARNGEIDYTCGDNDMVFFEFLIHFLANGLKRIVI